MRRSYYGNPIIEITPDDHRPGPARPLTDRQQEVVDLLLQGWTISEYGNIQVEKAGHEPVVLYHQTFRGLRIRGVIQTVLEPTVMGRRWELSSLYKMHLRQKENS